VARPPDVRDFFDVRAGQSAGLPGIIESEQRLLRLDSLGSRNNSGFSRHELHFGFSASGWESPRKLRTGIKPDLLPNPLAPPSRRSLPAVDLIFFLIILNLLSVVQV